MWHTNGWMSTYDDKFSSTGRSFMPAHTPDKPIRKSHATRERILEVARRWFSEQSYENVGVRELALDAGVDAALINRYFGGKKGLFTAVVAGAFDAENHLPSSIDDLGRFPGGPGDERAESRRITRFQCSAAPASGRVQSRNRDTGVRAISK